MKLDCVSEAQRIRVNRMCSAFAIIVGLAAAGCGAHVPAKTVATPEMPAATVHLTAADLGPEDAPKVGKPQRSALSVVDDEEGKMDPPRRHGEHKLGGGFSGYK